jgi:hypothetical protein
MLVERLESDDETEQYFTRRLSFTEKTKERLELFRHRSLQQTHDDDGRSSSRFKLLFFLHLNLYNDEAFEA